MPEKSIPDIVVSRLPRYLQALEHLAKDGIQTTSSQELGEFIGISAAQIRKDLSQYGEFGKQGKFLKLTESGRWSSLVQEI